MTTVTNSYEKLIDHCCVRSHDPMTRQDRSILDIGMPQSILHKRQISTRISLTLRTLKAVIQGIFSDGIVASQSP